MNDAAYQSYVNALAPKSPLWKDCLNAFWVGGLICTLGQLLLTCFRALGLEQDAAGSAVSISLIFLSAIFTGFSLYDDLAKLAGAGTLVPITGFANSIVAPAVEFKTEGLVLGTCAKMFIIAGPVLVNGLCASVVYGVIYWICTMI